MVSWDSAGEGISCRNKAGGIRGSYYKSAETNCEWVSTNFSLNGGMSATYTGNPSVVHGLSSSSNRHARVFVDV